MKPSSIPHHKERKHSKFSASGAERWFNCPGSVELSEGLPDKSSPWAEEGTKAHEILETILKSAIILDLDRIPEGLVTSPRPSEMERHAIDAANWMLKTHYRFFDSELRIETRVHLDFIHPEMFGTFDGAVIDHFGTLHVFDYKYGAGHAVSPRENLQMIFYGIGLANEYRWNFKKVRLWIIQPRIKGYDGPTWWELSISELKNYVSSFQSAVNRVLKMPEEYVEGSWCHFCKAKAICPIKKETKLEDARLVFSFQPTKSSKKRK